MYHKYKNIIYMSKNTYSIKFNYNIIYMFKIIYLYKLNLNYVYLTKKILVLYFLRLNII